jgi:hypothetical protein
MYGWGGSSSSKWPSSRGDLAPCQEETEERALSRIASKSWVVRSYKAISWLLTAWMWRGLAEDNLRAGERERLAILQRGHGKQLPCRS